MDGFEFAMGPDGLAHVCRVGNCWSLCHRETGATIRGKAAPCQTCLDKAAELIADQEDAA